ncbi:MAG TPA: hypothetical protein VFH90_07890 [Candidatus Limnocylindria bacterium]|nr:hypothetical protein [Candidatus Limnocylindria bacterium]
MTTARPIPSARRRGPALVAATIALALILAACGGGGGGGNGATTFKLRAATVNETATDATITLDVAGVPGEEQILETCRGRVFEFDLPAGEDWAMSVNGQVAIDSLALEENQIDRNLIAQVTVLEDGTVELESLSPGALIGPPAQSGICL